MMALMPKTYQMKYNLGLPMMERRLGGILGLWHMLCASTYLDSPLNHPTLLFPSYLCVCQSHTHISQQNWLQHVPPSPNLKLREFNSNMKIMSKLTWWIGPKLRTSQACGSRERHLRARHSHGTASLGFACGGGVQLPQLPRISAIP